MVTELLGASVGRARSLDRKIFDLHQRGFLMNNVHQGNSVTDGHGKVFVIDLGLAIP
jgi:hypothetical protein